MFTSFFEIPPTWTPTLCFRAPAKPPVASLGPPAPPRLVVFLQFLLLAQWMCLTKVTPDPSPPAASRDGDRTAESPQLAGSVLGSVMGTSHPLFYEC